jgi:DNA adenine methylase
MARSSLNEVIDEPKANRKGLSPIYLDEVDVSQESTTVYPRRDHKRKIVFGWYGGKFSHLDWLLPLLPECHHYCEPFGGSAAVLLNREPSPVETYNDIDGDVVNFFRVLRDRPDELIRAIALTPFSREEFYKAIYGSTKGITDLERARRYLCPCTSGQNRACTNGYSWSLGELQEY